MFVNKITVSFWVIPGYRYLWTRSMWVSESSLDIDICEHARSLWVSELSLDIDICEQDHCEFLSHPWLSIFVNKITVSFWVIPGYRYLWTRSLWVSESSLAIDNCEQDHCEFLSHPWLSIIVDKFSTAPSRLFTQFLFLIHPFPILLPISSYPVAQIESKVDILLQDTTSI